MHAAWYGHMLRITMSLCCLCWFISPGKLHLTEPDDLYPGTEQQARAALFHTSRLTEHRFCRKVVTIESPSWENIVAWQGFQYSELGFLFGNAWRYPKIRLSLGGFNEAHLGNDQQLHRVCHAGPRR